jgi:Uma2 family endonuclease
MRVELLNGEIFVMPRPGPEHAQSIRRLNKQFALQLSGQVYVSPQLPVVLLSPPPDYVEPDVTLLNPEEQYAGRNVTSSDVLLAIEVSDSTLARDQGEKLQAYARNSIPEVWIHNLGSGKLEVYREPGGEEYRSRQILAPGTLARVQPFPDTAIEWWT